MATREPTADAVLVPAPHQEFVAVIESMRSPNVGLQSWFGWATRSPATFGVDLRRRLAVCKVYRLGPAKCSSATVDPRRGWRWAPSLRNA